MQLRKEAEARAGAQTVGSLPAVINLILYQGDDFFLKIKLTQSVPPIDLTLFTPKAEIRQSPGVGLVLATFVTTIVDPLTIGLHLTGAQCSQLPAAAAWDVQIVDSAGVITTVAYGSISVTKEVTL